MYGEARQNGARIRKILIAEDGSADLYRTITAGPSSQRADKRVARVRYNSSDEYWAGVEQYGEIRIINPDGWETAGFADRRIHDGCQMWAIYADLDSDGIRFWGYAETLSLGCDVLINGEYAALKNHDSRRISGGKWIPNPHRNR